MKITKKGSYPSEKREKPVNRNPFFLLAVSPEQHLCKSVHEAPASQSGNNTVGNSEVPLQEVQADRSAQSEALAVRGSVSEESF